MDHKAAIHQHIRSCCDVLLAYIKEVEPLHPDRWVPTAGIKKTLDINFIAVPKINTPRGEKGLLVLRSFRRLEWLKVGPRVTHPLCLVFGHWRSASGSRFES